MLSEIDFNVFIWGYPGVVDAPIRRTARRRP